MMPKTPNTPRELVKSILCGDFCSQLTCHQCEVNRATDALLKEIPGMCEVVRDGLGFPLDIKLKERL